MMAKLAKALKVSIKFLSDDECEDPVADIEKDNYIEEARERYGAKGARDIDQLLADNAALFAGGELSQDQKDAFFQAVMTAYVTCKEEAKKNSARRTFDDGQVRFMGLVDLYNRLTRKGYYAHFYDRRGDSCSMLKL